MSNRTPSPFVVSLSNHEQRATAALRQAQGERSWRIAALGGFALALLTAPAAAHHSFAMFDQTKIVTLEGTVAEFQWTNPHAFIELEAAGGRHWSIELNSPNNLKRQGWTKAALKPGDRISLRMSPLRNGKPGGLFLDLTKADGKLLDSGLPKNGQPVNVPRL